MGCKKQKQIVYYIANKEKTPQQGWNVSFYWFSKVSNAGGESDSNKKKKVAS